MQAAGPGRVRRAVGAPEREPGEGTGGGMEGRGERVQQSGAEEEREDKTVEGHTGEQREEHRQEASVLGAVSVWAALRPEEEAEEDPVEVEEEVKEEKEEKEVQEQVETLAQVWASLVLVWASH